ncbi:hypothetical protein J6TS2_08220 [Heyndrickxia sporothermodurans]|nr:hypothetical protein J6TS2_08220 [Heyndrickxia sporothermodurans]
MKISKYLLGCLSTTFAFGAILINVHINPVKADSSEGFTGKWSGKKNSLNIGLTLTGDILFGYQNGCAYGKFSHTAIVAEGSKYKTKTKTWDGPIVESTSGYGKKSVRTNNKQSKFLKYDAASLTYFSKSKYKFSGSSVVKNAKKRQGPYSVLSSYKANDKWYCSKLVSRAVYDYNGYKLGKSYAGKFMTPSSVWYDSALKQRDKAVSSKYDGRSVWKKSKSTSLASVNITESEASMVNYKGYKIYTNNFSATVKKEVDNRINEEKKNKKSIGSKANSIVLSDAKPGLMDYLKDLLNKGKITKEEIKKEWNLSNEEIAKL